MSQVSISNFAKQAGTSIEKLLAQLAEAGVKGKQKDDLLDDAEKQKLIQFLQGSEDSRLRITRKRKTTNQIKQTSRTGAARTIHVEVKKKRTFVKRDATEPQHDEPTAKPDEQEPPQSASLEKPITTEPVKHPAQEVPPAEGATPTPAGAEATTEQTTQTEPTKQAEPTEPTAEAVLAAKETTQQKPEQTEPVVTKAGPKPAKANAKTPDESDSPSPASKEETPKSRKRNRKNKNKSKEKTQWRAELHVAKGNSSKLRRKPTRKYGKISSSISDAHAFAKPVEPLIHEVSIPESISVSDLAQAMSIKANQVIKAMMSMGSTVTIDQLIDQDTAMAIVDELGHVAKAAVAEDNESLLLAQDYSDIAMQPRPPMVTVMGHVDHGKTSLLDYIRQSKVTVGEAGGITQHIGAYKTKLEKGEICFLDTPGHEAFSAMRVRGAKLTDLVILVVAADDGVKPQTIEAISHARASGVPIVVAINKIDRAQADVKKVKQELSSHGVMGEEWGGDVLINEVSALSGEGVDALLESVLLQAEMLGLKARYSGAARGQVVEARLDKGRGPAATILVQQGILRKGDIVIAGRESGRVRTLTDQQGKLLEEAGPSTPVEIQGLDGVPVAGDDLFVVHDERMAREVAWRRQSKYKEVKLAKQQKHKLENAFSNMGEESNQSLNLLIKGDVQGSVEALSEALEKMSNDEVQIKIVHSMVGGINESDVNLAAASGAAIVGFNVRADVSARKLIEREESVEVHYCNVIYQVVDLVKALMSGMLSPLIEEKQVGLVEVRDVFRASKVGSIAGSFVTQGMVKRNLPVRVLRDNIIIFEGEIASLRRFKDDVNEVKNGLECGIGIKNYNDIKAGDQIEVFEIIETAQQL